MRAKSNPQGCSCKCPKLNHEGIWGKRALGGVALKGPACLCEFSRPGSALLCSQQNHPLAALLGSVCALKSKPSGALPGSTEDPIPGWECESDAPLPEFSDGSGHGGSFTPLRRFPVLGERGFLRGKMQETGAKKHP